MDYQKSTKTASSEAKPISDLLSNSTDHKKEVKIAELKMTAFVLEHNLMGIFWGIFWGI